MGYCIYPLSVDSQSKHNLVMSAVPYGYHPVSHRIGHTICRLNRPCGRGQDYLFFNLSLYLFTLIALMALHSEHLHPLK